MAGAPPVKGRAPGKVLKPTPKPKGHSGPRGIVADPRGGGLLNPKTGQKMSTVAPQARPVNVRGLQAQLRRAGYAIQQDGRMGPLTKAALADYLQLRGGASISPALSQALKGTVITGKRNPKAWNARFAPKSVVARPQDVDRRGNAKTTFGGGQAPSGGGSSAAAGSLDLRGLAAAAGPGGTTPIALALAQGGAKLFDPKMAETLAGLQYDGQIRDLGIERERTSRQNQQNARDIDAWYDQVLASRATAAGRDAAINKAAQGSIKDASAAIVSALGGSANAGAPMVAAAGQEAVGTLGALGSAQEQYNADLAPLLQAEAAGAKSREAAMGSTRMQDLALRLSSLQGERGQAVAANRLNLQGQNNAILDNRATRGLEIRQMNNSLAQQEFQNRLALANAQLSAMVTGAELQGMAGGAGAKAPKGSFQDTTANVRNNLFNQGVGAILDPNTGGLVKGLSVPGAVQRVNQIIAGLGWTRKDPNVLAFRNAILQAAGIRPDHRWR